MKYVTFFLPAYLRLTFKKITAVDIADASAQMSATMILTVKYQGLDKEMVKRVVRNMEIALNDDEFYSLCPDSKNQK